MRRKKPGVRRSFSPPVMEPKLLCPTLTVMITKTVKALCEVNIRFNNKLEISGCLHVRSDGEKVLTCLIDEETTRIKQEDDLPASERHEPIVSMLNSTLATALQAAAGVKPSETGAPNPGTQNKEKTTGHQENNTPPTESLEESIRAAVENSRAAEQENNQRVLGTVAPKSAPEVPKNPDMNTIIQNKDVLMGMLSDKNFNKITNVNTVLDFSNPSSQLQAIINAQQGKVAPTQNSPVFPQFNPLKSEPVDNPIESPTTTTSQPIPMSLNEFGMVAAANMAPDSTGQDPSVSSTPPPTAAGNNNMPTIDNIPYETMEVVTPRGGRTKKFQCMFCGIMLSTKGYLKNHINAVHTKARVYPCDICERLFYSAGALRIHKLRHHWVGSKKHKCGFCTEAFLLPIELRRHLQKKHGITNDQNSPSPSNLNDDNSSDYGKKMGDDDDVINIGEGEGSDDDEGSNSPLGLISHADLEAKLGTLAGDADLEVQMKLAQQAAQAHLQMVHDMAAAQAAAQAAQTGAEDTPM